MRTIALILLVASAAFSGESFACSCRPPAGDTLAFQVRAEFQAATIVAVGEIVELDESKRPDPFDPANEPPYVYSQHAKIKILKAWKGPKKAGEILETSTTTACCECGYRIAVGQRLLIYAWDKEPVSLSICSRTSPLGFGSPDVAVLDGIQESAATRLRPNYRVENARIRTAACGPHPDQSPE
jgi:hypothetical protein